MNNPTTDFNEWLDSLGFDSDSPENNAQAEQPSVTTANTTTTTSAVAHSGKGGSPATGDNMHPVILLFPFAGLVLSSFRRRRNG
jgi:hypothetical protein